MRIPDQLQQRQPAKQSLLSPFLVILSIGVVVIFTQSMLWPGGIGVGKDQSVTTISVEKDKQGNTTKTIETTKNDNGKTLWDWLSLLGVPLSLAILGYWLQQMQQKRAEKVARDQRELAADETREDVLQGYFDRLSTLLVDKNVLAIATKLNTSGLVTGKERELPDGERELLDSAIDVIRARTLSILRRFENDTERKTSVIQFLIEADVVAKLKLDLSKVNLKGADLSGANLSGANLSGAILKDAILKDARFNNTHLIGANLSGADLIGANLSGAKVSGATLSGADLSSADLSSADLIGAILSDAKLIKADLRDANLRDADFSGANLSGTKLSGARLRSADLSQANHLNDKQLEAAKLCETILPDKSTLTRDRDCKELRSEYSSLLSKEVADGRDDAALRPPKRTAPDREIP